MVRVGRKRERDQRYVANIDTFVSLQWNSRKAFHQWRKERERERARVASMLMREISLSGRPISASYNISALGLRWINIEFMREVQNVYWARNLAGYTQPHTQNLDAWIRNWENKLVGRSIDTFHEFWYIPFEILNLDRILLQLPYNWSTDPLFSPVLSNRTFDKLLDKLEWKNKLPNLLRRPIIYRLERWKKKEKKEMNTA